jgi:hypothetical protein
LENIQTDSSVIVNVGVENFGDKLHFGRFSRILIAEFQSKLKETAFPDGVLRPLDVGCPAVEAFLIRGSIDSPISFLA